MNRYLVLLLYLKDWGFSLTLKHYIYGGRELKFISEDKLLTRRKELLDRKIKIIKRVFEKDIICLGKKYSFIESDNNDIIWQYWDSKKKPKLISLCMKSIEKYASSYKRIELNDSNFADYVKLPDNIIAKYDKGIITKTHFSDILRVNLLWSYGGTWLDSTILLNGYYDFSSYNFWTVRTIHDNKSIITNGKWTGYAMSCAKNNKLMYYLVNLFEIYWERYNTLIDYFLIDIFINILCEMDDDVRNIMGNVPINNSYITDLDPIINECIQGIPDIMKETKIFKLNRKTPKKETNNGKHTLYKKLLDDYDIV